MLLHLLEFKVFPSAVIRTHEVYGLDKFSSLSFKKIWLAQQTVEIAILHTIRTYLRVLCPIVSTSRTCKRFAYATLPRLNGEIFANAADEIVQLIWVSSA